MISSGDCWFGCGEGGGGDEVGGEIELADDPTAGLTSALSTRVVENKNRRIFFC
jgi:hypothetical protein